MISSTSTGAASAASRGALAYCVPAEEMNELFAYWLAGAWEVDVGGAVVGGATLLVFW